jgi:Polyketide cyclase / dehydrase and lipid transport
MTPGYDVRTWSAAPPEQVFDLVADATTWKDWGPAFIMKSWFGTEGVPAPGGVGAIRKLGGAGFATNEEILEYDRPHYLAYTLLGHWPIKNYRATVSFDPHDNGTRIGWAASFDPVVPGTGRLWGWLLKRVIAAMATGLARYSTEQFRAAHSSE